LSTIILSKCETYNLNLIIKKMEKIFNYFGGIDKLIDKGSKVLLKPNLLSARPPEKAVITHPIFTAALIKILQKIKCKVYVGDSPIWANNVTSYNNLLKKTGYLEMLGTTNAEPINFLGALKKVMVPEFKIIKYFNLPAILKEFDYIISVPKFKTHALTHLTGAIKNSYGFIPKTAKIEYHFMLPEEIDFINMLLDLTLAVKVDFAIMDGILAMEGKGPASGEPRHLGLILFSKDIYSLDYVMAKIMGYKDPFTIPLLNIAKDRGLLNPSEIEIKGEPLESIRPTNFKTIKGKSLTNLIPSPIKRFILNFIRPYPYIEKSLCVKCNICVKVCPKSAISSGNNKTFPNFNYNKCIRCFCCMEACDKGAISTTGGLFSRVFRMIF